MNKKLAVFVLVLVAAGCGRPADVYVIEQPAPAVSPTPPTSEPLPPAACDDQEIDYAICLLERYAADEGDSEPIERIRSCKEKKPKKECAYE